MNERIVAFKRGYTQNMGIQAVLDLASEVVGNPICMLDLAFNHIAHTKSHIEDDVLWNELTQMGRFSHATFEFFKEEKFIDAFALSGVVSFMHSDKLKYDRVNGALFNTDDVQIADICVVAMHKPFSEGDFELIEELCEYFSIELQNSKEYNKITRVLEEKLVTDLIEGNNIDTSNRHIEIEKFFSCMKDYFFVGVVDTVSYEYTLTHLIYLRDLFKKLQPDFNYFIYLNNIVFLFSSELPILSEKRLEKLNVFFESKNIYAGISSAFQSPYELNKYFKQALNALNYGQKLKMKDNVYTHDEFRVELYMNARIDMINLNDLCHPIVFVMDSYDKKHGTDYVELIYTYMMFGQNVYLTAKQLGLTSKELRERLRVIGKTFDIDRNKGNILHNIYRSIKIIKCFKDELSSK